MAAEKLKVRKQIKSRKPTFKRSQTNQFAKFKGDSWRSPKGMGNKIRRGRKGHINKPTSGYGSPKEVRGLNHNGLREVLVANVSDLANVNAKEDVVVIKASVGKRKRLEILTQVKSKSLKLSSVKSVDELIKALTKAPKKETKKEAPAKKASEKKAPSANANASNGGKEE